MSLFKVELKESVYDLDDIVRVAAVDSPDTHCEIEYARGGDVIISFVVDTIEEVQTAIRAAEARAAMAHWQEHHRA